MFHFPTFPPHTLFNSGAGTQKQLWVGSPIRTPSDHSPLVDSPRPIVDYHVLHRLLMPRHPPYAHKNLTTHPVAFKPLDALTRTKHKNQKHNKTIRQHKTTNQTHHLASHPRHLKYFDARVHYPKINQQNQPPTTTVKEPQPSKIVQKTKTPDPKKAQNSVWGFNSVFDHFSC